MRSPGVDLQYSALGSERQRADMTVYWVQEGLDTEGAIGEVQTMLEVRHSSTLWYTHTQVTLVLQDSRSMTVDSFISFNNAVFADGPWPQALALLPL